METQYEVWLVMAWRGGAWHYSMKSDMIELWNASLFHNIYPQAMGLPWLGETQSVEGSSIRIPQHWHTSTSRWRMHANQNCNGALVLISPKFRFSNWCRNFRACTYAFPLYCICMCAEISPVETVSGRKSPHPVPPALCLH